MSVRLDGGRPPRCGACTCLDGGRPPRRGACACLHGCWTGCPGNTLDREPG
jgi:hypothetical protein